jgi:uncharacterized membrane protein
MQEAERRIATGAYFAKVAARIKTASGGPMGFAWIGDAPEIGRAYPNEKLEADFQMQHPIMSTLHPGVYGGAAVGGLAGYAARGLPGAAAGASIGLLAGSLGEGALRYRHLMNARERMLAGKNPVDPNLSLDQFGKHASLEMISVVPSMGGHFADHRLEQDYVMKHPTTSTLHPGIYLGAAGGAALGALRGHAATGLLLGGSAGMLAEGVMRANYLLDARRKLLAKQNPVDTRFSFSQF